MNHRYSKKAEVFWSELAPCDHLVQIYENDAVFLDTLEGYIAGGLRSGDSTIVIANSLHLNVLEERLYAQGIDLNTAISQERYIPLDAAETISKFIVDGRPDETLFDQVVSAVLNRARKYGKHVRAFGEMVAILWQRGFHDGTIHLEHLWHQLCQKEGFSLLCAYPKSGFTDAAKHSIETICGTHSRVISGRWSNRLS